MELIDKLKTGVEDFRDNRASAESMLVMGLGLLAAVGLLWVAGKVQLWLT